MLRILWRKVWEGRASVTVLSFLPLRKLRPLSALGQGPSAGRWLPCSLCLRPRWWGLILFRHSVAMSSREGRPPPSSGETPVSLSVVLQFELPESPGRLVRHGLEVPADARAAGPRTTLWGPVCLLGLTWDWAVIPFWTVCCRGSGAQQVMNSLPVFGHNV